MEIKTQMDMSKYLTKHFLFKLCKDICITVRNRIPIYYESKQIKFDTYEGECNRACLLFYLYFHKEMMDRQFHLITNAMGDNTGKPTYKVVNMPNIKRLSTFDPLMEYGINIEIIHGEQKHSPRIKKEYWYIEHTWLVVNYKDISIYVDPTCGQFKWLWKGIPEYYVSTKKPKWFYPDSENPQWNKDLK